MRGSDDLHTAVHDEFSPQVRWGVIALFLAILAAISIPLYIMLIRAGRLDIGRGFPIHLLMWAPAAAAIVTCRLTGFSTATLGLNRFPVRALWIGYGVVLAYSLASYLPLWWTGLAPLNREGFARNAALLYAGIPHSTVLTILFTLTFGVLQSGASALGEEIGWRGFLVPVLHTRISLRMTLIISGSIWALWHFPLIIFADYNADAPLWVQLICFSGMIVATGSIYALFRLRFDSVWPAVLMHALHNALIQWLLDQMTVETGGAALYAGEFGLALSVVTMALAIYLYCRWIKASPLQAGEPSLPKR